MPGPMVLIQTAYWTEHRFADHYVTTSANMAAIAVAGLGCRAAKLPAALQLYCGYCKRR